MFSILKLLNVRLDKFLVLKGYFSSREKAKEAIKRGFIKVNGVVITKPSHEVSDRDSIEILISKPEKPRGYWKLMEIDTKWRIFDGDEVVLDLGSSAGGFLQYASERAKFVYGIEVSEKFRGTLKKIENERDNVRVFINDAFKFNVNKLPTLDLILLDMTLDPESSLKALKRFLPKLRENGKILFVAKIGKDSRIPDFKSTGLEILDQVTSKRKKEIYILLAKRS